MKLKIALAAAAASLAFAVPAQAAPYLFTLTGNYSASWQLESSPTPDNSNPSFFLVAGVEGDFPGLSASSVDLYFYTPEIGGGFTIFDVAAGINLADALGVQLFSGPTSAPTFLTGTFDLAGSGGAQAFQLVISEAPGGAVPEPATWALMMLGFGAIGFAMRRRRQVTTTVRYA